MVDNTARVQEIKEIISKHPEYKIIDIAHEMFLSDSTISNLIKNNNIRYNNKKHMKYKGLDYDKVSKFIKNNPNLNLEKIGNKFGVTKPTISGFIKANNIPYNFSKVKYVPVDKKDIIEFIKEHPSYKINDILSHFEIPISYILNRWSWKELGYVSKSKRDRYRSN